MLAFSCKKKDMPQLPSIKYGLSGWYLRDSTIKTNGLKGIHFTDNNEYCWLRVVNGNDSLTCFGTYNQTSDSTLLWNDKFVVNFKITPIDTLPGIYELRVSTTPPSAPLYGPFRSQNFN